MGPCISASWQDDGERRRKATSVATANPWNTGLAGSVDMASGSEREEDARERGNPTSPRAHHHRHAAGRCFLSMSESTATPIFCADDGLIDDVLAVGGKRAGKRQHHHELSPRFEREAAHVALLRTNAPAWATSCAAEVLRHLRCGRDLLVGRVPSRNRLKICFRASRGSTRRSPCRRRARVGDAGGLSRKRLAFRRQHAPHHDVLEPPRDEEHRHERYQHRFARNVRTSAARIESPARSSRRRAWRRCCDA